jgi:hypothetical protein
LYHSVLAEDALRIKTLMTVPTLRSVPSLKWLKVWERAAKLHDLYSIVIDNRISPSSVLDHKVKFEVPASEVSAPKVS